MLLCEIICGALEVENVALASFEDLEKLACGYHWDWLSPLVNCLL
jgi:hypothetical protein